MGAGARRSGAANEVAAGAHRGQSAVVRPTPPTCHQPIVEGFRLARCRDSTLLVRGTYQHAAVSKDEVDRVHDSSDAQVVKTSTGPHAEPPLCARPTGA